ncbi:MAG: porin [Planctomycetota bacterium]
MSKFSKFYLAAFLVLGTVASAMAVEIPANEWEAIKQRMATLEANNAASSSTVGASAIDSAMDSKYGPNANVTTKTGKLTIGLLTQVWYYDIQRDNQGFFNDGPNGANGIIDNNLAGDINSFRIRRTELKFTMDITECITSVLMFDPAREVGGFPSFPSNQGLFKKSPTANGGLSTSTTATGGFAGGVGSPPRLLQDAYINYHGVIPYHDFQVGQFKAFVGEEGIRSSAELDFAERSILGQCADNRDMGRSVHGSWWGKDCNDRDGRFQYWLGVFNGSGTYYNPGNQQNRSDNNQSKDFNGRLLVRPIWDDCMGQLELGASYIGGRHGLGSEGYYRDGFPAVTATTPIPAQSWASKGNVWFSYKCGNAFAKGLWVKGEWGYIHDRQEGSVVAFGNGNLSAGLAQTAVRGFTSQGGYGALGYRFSQSQFAECIPCYLKPLEIAARYEQFGNIQTANIANPTKTSVFNTHVMTAGLNYYFTGNTKIQANYNYVDLPTEKTNLVRKFHDTQNNSFVVNFQVAF